MFPFLSKSLNFTNSLAFPNQKIYTEDLESKSGENEEVVDAGLQVTSD